MTRTPWTTICIAAAGVSAAVLAFLIWATPRTEEGGLAWTEPMVPGGWMAWVLPTALFFWVIGSLLILFTILAIRFPETPRRGILGIETTRGDRLFISLLGSGFVCLTWMFFFGAPLWGALICCLVYAAAVFRWV
jgi:predicted small integral membrane protein